MSVHFHFYTEWVPGTWRNFWRPTLACKCGRKVGDGDDYLDYQQQAARQGER